MSHDQEYSSNPQPTDPFLIIYNYRKIKEHTDSVDKPKRRPHDYSLDRQSIILTRKMKANLQEKEQSVKSNELEKVVVVESQLKSVSEGIQDSKFFAQNQLQKGIPMSDSQDEDILFNRNQMSWASNYSKLQKTLFAMNFPSNQKEEEVQQIYKNEL